MTSPQARPLVSVITPTYNRAGPLRVALRSALDQDFRDLELIVIDDGSTDETARVVESLHDPRVRYARFDGNRGIGAARNEGVTQARGELIAFLDSDDRWKPGKLAEIVAAFGRHPNIDIAFSDYEDFNYIHQARERGFRLAAAILNSLSVGPLGAGWWAIEAGVPEGLMRGNFIGTSSVVALHRRVFDRAGNFRVDLSGPEDMEFWWRSAVLGARFAYTTEVLVERHKDTGSITALKREFVPQRLRALDACAETARRAGRLDLLAHVRRARARTWCDLIEVCAREGRRGAAVKAFWSSLRFGLSLDALRYLAAALAGPRLVAVARRMRGP